MWNQFSVQDIPFFVLHLLPIGDKYAVRYLWSNSRERSICISSNLIQLIGEWTVNSDTDPNEEDTLTVTLHELLLSCESIVRKKEK